MNPAPSGLEALTQRRPEWAPWLAVVEHALRACSSDAWVTAIDGAGCAPPPAPLLAGASMRIAAKPVSRLLDRLVTTAVRSGTKEMATLRGLLRIHVDLHSFVSAAVARRRSAIEAVAASAGADPEALEAIAGLLGVPLLQACRRASSVSESWTDPYCPMCGAWPALAEVRGIERSRFFRCGRCGSEWRARMLACAYCGLDDHERLVTLVPEQGGAAATIDACRNCRGYVKVLARLQGCSPERVMVEDLATVDLDLAAVADGYARPGGLGYAVDVSVLEASAGSARV